MQVVERHRPPEAADRSAVTNIVARRSGLITKVEALEGQAMVLPGTTVTEGQLLISGVSETEHIGARFVHSMGAVWARTWYELSVSVPLQITQPPPEAAATAAGAGYRKTPDKILRKGWHHRGKL